MALHTEIIHVDRSIAGVQAVMTHGRQRCGEPGQAPGDDVLTKSRRAAQEKWVRARLLEQGCITHHLEVTDVRSHELRPNPNRPLRVTGETQWSFQVPTPKANQ